ncbi:MAG TPA: LamG-like jellyroll fold domain-containing protein [Thermoguttaceae bacterium]|nr:LamG-like jellyroll fold domain-containing protein [Thermoguttaceae bacterium]
MMSWRQSVLVLVLLVATLSDDERAWAVEVNPISPGSWTMVILPDTQRYSLTYPQIFTAQTNWIASHKTSQNIQMVLHEGDITHTLTTPEWNNAKTSMSVLDAAGVPYSMAIGNHDIVHSTRGTLFNSPTYFGPGSAYAAQSSIGGFFESLIGKTDNSYSTFSAGGEDWLVFSTEFAPRNEVIAWMDGVATAHPNHNLILNTHAYLYSDDTRYDWATYGTAQLWNPHDPNSYAALLASGTTVNDGQELWDKLVKKHANWKFVFNGHVLNDGTGWAASAGNHGNVVHQILANYQMDTNGGNGYLRVLEFMADGDTVKVSSYSPYQQAYLTDPDQSFTLKMSQLTPRATVWAMDFESEEGVGVYHGRALSETAYAQDGVTETTYDPDGGARNTGGSTVSYYARYTHASVPAMPADMIATGRRGNYAVRMGNTDWRVASQIPCTWGDSDKTHTIEGLFNNQEDLVTTLDGQYDAMKRTFVQTKRSSNDFQLSRIWVGMGVKSDPLGQGDDIPVLALMYATEADPTVSFVSALGDTEIVQGDWHHFALVLDTYDVNGTEMSDLKVYLDGMEEIFLVGLTDLHFAGSKTFTLGEAWAAGNESGAASFKGYLDAIQITNAALSPDEFYYVPLPGDATHDGQVNEADATRIAQHWGATALGGGLTWWEMGDFNGDHAVNARDASILAANWGSSLSESNPVPEPSLLGLWSVGILLSSLRRRRSLRICRGKAN